MNNVTMIPNYIIREDFETTKRELRERNNYTYLPKEIIKTLNKKELSIMLFLLIIKNDNKNKSMFNLKSLYKTFDISNKNTYTQNEIKNILNKLSENKYVIYYDDTMDNNILDMKKVKVGDIIVAEFESSVLEEDNIIINDKNIKTIIEYGKNNKIDLYLILQSYLYLYSLINNNKISTFNINKISVELNIVVKTLKQYMIIFKNMNLLFCDIIDCITSEKVVEEIFIISNEIDGFSDKVHSERIKNGFYGKGSSGEISITNILSNINVNFKKEHTFEDLKNINSLRFDFAIFEGKDKLKLLIEYDGEQHYYPVNFGGISDKQAEEKFINTIYNDAIKNSYCEDNHIPLLRIPFWEFNNMKSIIENKLNLPSINGGDK